MFERPRNGDLACIYYGGRENIMPEVSFFIAASLLVTIPVAFVTPSISTIPISVATIFSFFSMRDGQALAASLSKYANAMFINLVDPAKHITVPFVPGTMGRLLILPGIPKFPLPVR